MEKARSSRPSGCTSLRWSTWGQQWWAMLGAFTVLIAMIILLDSFDGRPIFSWNGITLNTITSILSVTVKAAALFVIAECMAQWKWILFAREQRPLIDFDRLDGVTRGPMGSLRLILKTRGAFIAQFGAVLTLVALALDPFAQQLVQLREDIVFGPVVNGSVSVVPKAQTYSIGDMTWQAQSAVGWTNKTGTLEQIVGYSSSSNASLSPTMEAAVSSGFFKSLEDVSRERFFYCQTGKCTFPPFLTLGVCHKSHDITSELKHSSKDQDFNGTLRAFGKDMVGNLRAHGSHHASAFGLPNGHFMANIDGTDPISCKQCATYLVTSFGTENPNKTVSIRGIDTLIWPMSFIYPDIKAYNISRLFENGDESKVWPNIPMLATETALYYCVKNVTASVVDNKFPEEVTEVLGVTRTIDSWDAALLDENNGDYQAPPEEARALVFASEWSARSYNDLQLQVPGHNTPFYVTPMAIFSISAHLQRLFRWPEWHNSTAVRRQLRQSPAWRKLLHTILQYSVHLITTGGGKMHSLRSLHSSCPWFRTKTTPRRRSTTSSTRCKCSRSSPKP